MSIEIGFEKMLSGMDLMDEGKHEILAGMKNVLDGVKDLDFKIDHLKSEIAEMKESNKQFQDMIINLITKNIKQ